MIHPTAEVSPRAQVDPSARVWHYAQLREGSVVGANCMIGRGAYVDRDVTIGDNVKVQNDALIYHGATIESGVFIGPQACLANDRTPRAITPDGRLRSADDWETGRVTVKYGASIGAGAVLVPDVTIGRFAMVAAGAVVTHDVPDQGLVMGIPAIFVGHVCYCGRRLAAQADGWRCGSCGREFGRLDDS